MASCQNQPVQQIGGKATLGLECWVMEYGCWRLAWGDYGSKNAECVWILTCCTCQREEVEGVAWFRSERRPSPILTLPQGPCLLRPICARSWASPISPTHYKGSMELVPVVLVSTLRLCSKSQWSLEISELAQVCVFTALVLSHLFGYFPKCTHCRPPLTVLPLLCIN